MAPSQDVGPQQREDRKYCWVRGSYSSSFPHNGQLSHICRCPDHTVCFLAMTCHAKSHMLSILHTLVAVSLWNLKTKTLHRHVRRCTEATTTCQHCQPEGKSFEWIDPLAILSLFLNDDDLFCGKILLSTSMVPLIVSATSASRCTARTILEGFHK